MTSYIIDIPQDEVLFLAHLLHFYLHGGGEDPIAWSALGTLIQQTNCVGKDPHMHHVYPDVLLAPKDASFSRLDACVTELY